MQVHMFQLCKGEGLRGWQSDSKGTVSHKQPDHPFNIVTLNKEVK